MQIKFELHKMYYKKMDVKDGHRKIRKKILFKLLHDLGELAARHKNV